MIETIIISLRVVTVSVHFYKKSGNFWKSIVNIIKLLTLEPIRPFRKPDDPNLNDDCDSKVSEFIQLESVIEPEKRDVWIKKEMKKRDEQVKKNL